MTHDQLINALNHLRPGAQWCLRGETYADIVWLDAAQTQPTELEIAALGNLVDASVPDSVPMWKAKAALAMAGKLSAANAAVSASGNDVVMLAWEYAAEINRHSTALAQMAAALGLTEVEVDQLFIAASQIAV